MPAQSRNRMSAEQSVISAPGPPLLGRNANKDEVVILSEKKPSRRNNRSRSAHSMIKMETSSSLSVLGEKLTKDLVNAAETAIKSHLQQLRNDAKVDKNGAANGAANNGTKNKNAIVLQLNLPKDLQLKLMEQLKSQGKAHDQIDMNNLFSEVFNRTLRRMNGLEITNCSLRINSAKKRPMEDSPANTEVPAKKVKNFNNNTTTTNSASQNGHHHTETNGVVQNGIMKRPRGRPPKKPKMMNCSKRLHAHAVKEWPYQPPEQPPKEEIQPPVKKKGKMRGPHRENNKVKFLRRVQLKDQQFISLDFFNQLFTGFKLNPNALISTLVTLYSEDPSQDFMFKKWQMTHLSIRCVQDIITLMKKPLFLVKALEQLKTLPVIPLRQVNPDDYNKTHLSQLSKNEFCNLFALGPTRMSTRTKQLTQKFQNSPCSSSMASLTSAITTPPKKIQFSGMKHKKNLKKSELMKSLDKSWLSGRLRPKYRLLIEKKKVENPKEKDDFLEDFSFLEDVAANEDELIVLEEEDDQEILDVTEMSTRLEQEENKPQLNKLAVRKFPSYGWCREREAKIKEEMATAAKVNDNNSEKNAPADKVAAAKKSVVVNRSLDFPPFQLSGLAETAPKEVEGWFTSKVSLLRKLSANDESAMTSTSPKSSLVKKKVTKVQGKVLVKSFLDDQIEPIVDLPEYKANLEQINNIIEEIENTEKTDTDNNDEVNAIEALRVAKKIEKISIAGLGRQVCLPNPNSYLPPGWHCVKTDQGLEYVHQQHGYKVKSVQAAIKYQLTNELFDS